MLFPLGRACKARAPLELIYADLCGPMRTPSLKSSIYVFLIVDEYIKINWVNFLKEKAKGFQIFFEFMTLIENMFRYFIKTLHIDRGGEFQ